MKIEKKLYGLTNDGKEAYLYTVTNDKGMEVSFTNYGACIVSIIVPDSKGNKADVVLGYDNLEGYQEDQAGFGAFIGRYANRISEGKFVINGKTYELEKNDGNNTLHGGSKGYNKCLYETEIFQDEDMISVEFSRLSPHMEQGFPGNLDISVTYSLSEANELMIEYLVVSDQDTIINLTNHSYFNLAGHNSGSALDHKLWIKANQYNPTNNELIPTGELKDVTGTPMDFRKSKSIGQDIDLDYEPLRIARGYDHNYVLDLSGDDVEKVAQLVHEDSGRVMEVFTDMPGMQLYSSNMLESVKNSKDGASYNRGQGICFETQFFPNSCNTPEFPSSMIRAGEEFESVTIYKFSAK
ncbi:MAG TPA: galactose mutarotase [Clostridiales bacterium]|nr:galactose mutarotase [Clostridiales bacterium]